MVYFISIFFPFIGLFCIKKPVMGYFSLVAHLLILLGHSLYPTPLIIFLLWIFLVLWTFFEINDYRTKRAINRITKILSTEESLVVRNSEEDKSFLSQNPNTSLLDLPIDQNRSIDMYPIKSNTVNQNLHDTPIEQEGSIEEVKDNGHNLRADKFDSRFYPASNERLQENSSYYTRNQDTYTPYTSGYARGSEEESYSDKNIVYNDNNSGNHSNINNQRISSNYIDNNYQSSGGNFANTKQANVTSRDLPSAEGNQASQINPTSYGNYELNSPSVEERMQAQNLQQNRLLQNPKIIGYNQNNFVKSNTLLPPKQNHLLPSQGKALYKNYNKALEQETMQGELEKRENFRAEREKVGSMNYNNFRTNLLGKPMIRGFASREPLREDHPEEFLNVNYPRNNRYNMKYRNNIFSRR